jgi:hypothetical protein
LARLEAHLLGHTPSLQVFQITFSLLTNTTRQTDKNPSESASACTSSNNRWTENPTQVQRTICRWGGRHRICNEWSSQQLNPETQTRQAEALPSINIRSHHDTCHVVCVQQRPPLANILQEATGGPHRHDETGLETMLRALVRTRASNGSRCCMRLSQWARGGARSQRRGAKSEP